MSPWQPTAELATLARRAQLLSQLRLFFADRGVLEVETPLLASAPVSDPNIEAIAAAGPQGELFLQTSPEYAMKRLLAAGSGPIYQICKAFRHGERGRRHNPEFTMLEWYRPGLSLVELMAEVVAVIEMALADTPPVQTLSYAQAFQAHCGLHPHRASLVALRAAASARMELSFDSEERDLWLQLLMSTVVEPALPAGQITLIHDFPASQAALAKTALDAEGHLVAHRFEAFYRGMELANGYHELQDAQELISRIRRDHALRRSAGQRLPPIDRHLLKAMQAGLPDCVGVAMGFDRLVMLATGATTIDEVIAFPLERA